MAIITFGIEKPDSKSAKTVTIVFTKDDSIHFTDDKTGTTEIRSGGSYPSGHLLFYSNKDSSVDFIIVKGTTEKK